MPRDGCDSNYLCKRHFCFVKYIIDIYKYWKRKIVHKRKINYSSIREHKPPEESTQLSVQENDCNATGMKKETSII
jgi:hypothetical protein